MIVSIFMVVVVKIKSRREICALFASVFGQSKRDRGKTLRNFEIRFQSSFCLDTKRTKKSRRGLYGGVRFGKDGRAEMVRRDRGI